MDNNSLYTERTCESLGAVTRRERKHALLPLVPRSIIDRMKSLPSRVPVCDATSQVKRKFNETSPRGISRLARTKDATCTRRRNAAERKTRKNMLHMSSSRRNAQSTSPRGKIHVSYFFSCQKAPHLAVYTSARHFHVVHCSLSSIHS